ncbi:MAG: heme-binding protein [Proteobacteria bacterium]|nr:heme-binding protein [Pseudomonadota bacterium]
MRTLAIIMATLALSGNALAQTDPGTISFKTHTPETALKAAQAAMKKCRDSGWQAAVAVVDRSGTAIVMLRDRFAGAHTPETAVGKAWTAVSFRTPTTSLAETTQPGRPSSGIRSLPRVTAIGGGLLIESAGQIVGGIGVSGAPGGDNDDTCAKAGIDAIADALAF